MRFIIFSMLLCACGDSSYIDINGDELSLVGDGGYTDRLVYLTVDYYIHDMTVRGHGDIYSLEQDDMSSGYNPCVVPPHGPMYPCLTEDGQQRYDHNGFICIQCQDIQQVCVTTFLGYDILCLANCGWCY